MWDELQTRQFDCSQNSKLQALLDSKDYRDNLAGRVLRVVFRETKGTHKNLAEVFAEKDAKRSGFLTRSEIMDCLFGLQGREFVSKQDVRIFCIPFETSDPELVVEYIGESIDR